MSNNFIDNNNQYNAGYLFYKEYFKVLPEIDKLNFAEINKNLEKLKVREVPAPAFTEGLQCINMQTTYPGLLIGSGYIHDANSSVLDDKDCKDEAYKIGFFFDHVSGMPLIPGSGIKGMLRSFFPNEYKSEKGSKDYSNKRVKLIKSILKLDLSESDIDELEEQIFAGNLPQGKRQGCYERDIFFDATPVDGKKLFCSDYITPHLKDGKPAPLQNPTPIKFLKIAPQVEYRFAFKLHDYTLSSGKTVTKNIKLNLFRAIIEYAGVGAKTNVGYGQFEETEAQKKIRETKEAIEKIELDRKEAELREKQRREQAEKDRIECEKQELLKKQERAKKTIEEKTARENNKAKRQNSVQEKGISDLLAINKIDKLSSALPKWARDYYGDNNITKKKELKGKLIPKEHQDAFVKHINSIYNAGVNKKTWKESYYTLQRYLAEIPIE